MGIDETYSFEEFSNWIVQAASLPRHMRGNLDNVNVIGQYQGARTQADGSIDRNYQFEFVKRVSGEDNQFRDLCSLFARYNQDDRREEFDPKSQIKNYLSHIQRLVGERNNSLVTEIEGNCLTVESAFKTITEKSID